MDQVVGGVYACACVHVCMCVRACVLFVSFPELGIYSDLFSALLCASFEDHFSLLCASSVVSPTCGLLCTELDTWWGGYPTSTNL